MELFAGIFIAITVIGIIGIIGIEIALHSVKPWKKIRKKDLDKYYNLPSAKVKRYKDDKRIKR